MKNYLKVINSVAPIRICDNGGWTDTWFAGHGSIFNIGVYPYTEVQIKVFSRNDLRDAIVVNAENYGDRFIVQKGNRDWSHHPLLEAAFEYMNIPNDVALEASIYSEAPAGASTGTSAAVTVALIGSLDRLTPGRMTPYEVALTAQKIETEMLGQQCGIQDQLCSAYGGINFINMYQYPYASVSQIHIPDSVRWELEKRLVLIYLGHSHNSSNVHQKVISNLEGSTPDNPALKDLRKTAEKSRDATYEGDFKKLGQAMIENTNAQIQLHPELVSKDARNLIKLAQKYDALGWKVNGAGGNGGSMTLLMDSESVKKRRLIEDLKEINPLFQNIPIYLSRFGLRVWESI